MSRLRFGLGALGLTREELTWFSGSLLGIAIAMAAFLRVATLRWNSFETNAFDLAFFDQIIFNTSRGRWFDTSFIPYNFAGQHLQPILVAYVPAYWLGAGPYFLMVSQAVVGALAAVPLFFFARKLGLHAAIATAAVVAYLANPYLHRAMAFDFHPEVMAAFPVFFAAWAIAADRRRLAVVSTLSVLAFKEDTVFLALALAGYMWIRDLRREAMLTAGVALGWALLGVFVVMPLVRDGQASDLVQRFGYLLPHRTVADFLLVPLRAAKVLLAPAQLWTMALFIGASSLVVLWRPVYLVVLVPGLGLALLSTHGVQRHLEFHYAAELVPLIVVAALLAAVSLRERIGTAAVAVAVVAPPLLAAAVFHPLADGHAGSPSAQHRTAVLAALALVPGDENVSVSAQTGLLPRIAHHRGAYEFPDGFEHADWIVVDRSGVRSSRTTEAGWAEHLETVSRTKELVFAEDGVEVYRGAP